MNPKKIVRNPWSGKPGRILCIACLLLVISVACSSASTQAPEVTEVSVTEAQAAPATAAPTATSEPLVPVGWVTYTSQQCEYTISYPAEMQVSDETPHSSIFGFQLEDPGQGAINFIYVSVIDPQIQSMVQAGVYNNEVYNYDPVATDVLLNMQVGESIPVYDLPDQEAWFTYERKPDTQISGYAAQTYENTQPWEFPSGTKEIRHYLSLDGCTYMIGGYIDTTQSGQPGAISEELFNQIAATIQLNP